MKKVILLKYATDIISEYGFEGLLYVILGLIIIAIVSVILACIPAAIAVLGFSADKETRNVVFWLSAIVIFFLINICM